MRIRIKFTKTGCMKFIGHLDVMRYFQKALRRAELPVALSTGFSPHMLMSFAAPLGVGKTSGGEYVDLDLKDGPETEGLTEQALLARLNAQMAEGITVTGAVRIPETKAAKGMTVVAAADYQVSFRKGQVALPEDAASLMARFLAQPTVEVLRKTKRSEELTDIRPWIYEMALVPLTPEQCAAHPSGCAAEPVALRMVISQGSVQNLRPELAADAFLQFAGVSRKEHSLLIHRNDILADIGAAGARTLVPLSALGTALS